jgi:hypothetical protein
MKETLVIYDKACVDSIDNTDEFLKEVLMIPTFEDGTCMLVCLSENCMLPLSVLKTTSKFQVCRLAY